MKMKRTLSLVLAIILAFGSFTFASPAADHNTVGNELKALGVIKGDDSGNLMTGEKLTREQAVVVLVRMMGKEADAQSTPAKTDFTDVPEDNYYAPYIAYAKLQGWTKGTSETTFGLGTDVTTQQVATFMLRALGYTDVAYENAMTEAAKMGLTKDVSAAATDAVVRGEVFVMMKNTLYTNAKDAKINLVYQLGLIAEPEAPQASVSNDNIKDVKAIAANQVEVVLKDAVTAVAPANFSLTEKGADKAIEVKDAKLENPTTVVLTTDVLTATKAYTVNGVNFTAIAKVTDAPTIKNIVGADLNKFSIEFTAKMDFDKATDVANYAFSGGLKVVKVELVNDEDSRAIGMNRRTVNVYTDAAKANRTYNLTIDGLTNTDGVKLVKVTRAIVASEDRIAPTLSVFQVQNNRMIVLTFKDVSGIDKASAEDVANYTIDGLGVVAAKAYDTIDDEKTQYDTVVLTTDTQTAGKSYKLVINNLTDASETKNSMPATTRTFVAASPDAQGPTVFVGADAIRSLNNNIVEVKFSDANAMNKESVEDVANYVIKDTSGNILPILEAKSWSTDYKDGYTPGKKGVTLTTAQQDLNKQYTIEVKGVQDEFGNALKSVSGTTYNKFHFSSSKVDTVPPYVKEVKFVDKNTVRVFFDDTVKGSVNDPTNFVFDGGLGQAVKSKFYNDGTSTSNKIIELTTPNMVPNKEYIITINNLVDRFENETTNVKARFIATRTELDLVAPKMTYIYAPSNQELHVNFDEAIDNRPGIIRVKEYDTATDKFVAAAAEKTFNLVTGTRMESTTAVYVSTGAANKLENKTYKISSVGGGTFFYDAPGNKLTLADLSGVLTTDAQKAELKDRVLFSGTATDNADPEYVAFEQLDVKTIRFTFNKPVKAVSPTVSTYTVSEPVDKPYNLDVKMPGSSVFKHGTSYDFDLTTFAKDFVGAVARDYGDSATDKTKVTKFTAYMTDDVAPYIVKVEAPHNKRIEITYSEPISAQGTYKIYYYDLNQKVQYVVQAVTPVALSGNSTVGIIEFREDVATKLELDKTYYIEVVGGAKDIAGNKEADNKVTFPGTDIVVDKFISGVAIVNASNAQVTVLKSIKGGKIYRGTDKDNRVQIGTIPAITVAPGNVKATTAILPLSEAVINGRDYYIEVEWDFVTTAPTTYAFKGITENPAISASLKGNVLTIVYAGMDNEMFDYYVFNPSTSSYALLAPQAGSERYVKAILDVSGFGITAGTNVKIQIKDQKTGSIVYSTIIVPVDANLSPANKIARTFSSATQVKKGEIEVAFDKGLQLNTSNVELTYGVSEKLNVNNVKPATPDSTTNYIVSYEAPDTFDVTANNITVKVTDTKGINGEDVDLTGSPQTANAMLPTELVGVTPINFINSSQFEVEFKSAIASFDASKFTYTGSSSTTIKSIEIKETAKNFLVVTLNQPDTTNAILASGATLAIATDGVTGANAHKNIAIAATAVKGNTNAPSIVFGDITHVGSDATNRTFKFTFTGAPVALTASDIKVAGGQTVTSVTVDPSNSLVHTIVFGRAFVKDDLLQVNIVNSIFGKAMASATKIKFTDATTTAAFVAADGQITINVNTKAAPKLRYGMPVYINGTAVTNNADVKTSFKANNATKSASAISITAAVYTTANNDVTFAVANGADTDTITFETATAVKFTDQLGDAFTFATISHVMTLSSDSWAAQ